MVRAIAGIYDPDRGRDPHVSLRALARSFSSPEGSAVTTRGPLAVAWAGKLDGVPPESGICVPVGQLYNAAAIAGQLGKPPTEPVTRILATGYDRWGVDLFRRLRGSFAACLWDDVKEHGVLVRDQLGGVPLFFHVTSGRVAFASEIRLLLGLLERSPDPNGVALVDWLLGRGPKGDSTLYSGVNRLGPGQVLELRADGIAQVTYWSPRFRTPLPRSHDEAVDEVRGAAARAVHRRVGETDVTHVLMSGGIDSTSVAALAAEVGRADSPRLEALSAVFPSHSSADEGALISAVASHIGIPSVQLRVHEVGSVLAGCLNFLRQVKVPPITPNHHFMETLIAGAAERGGPSVVLDGHGGDELFDLSPYLFADRLRQGRVVSALRLMGQVPGAAGRPPLRGALSHMWNFGLIGALPHDAQRLTRRFRSAVDELPSWLGSAAVETARQTDDSLSWKRLDGPRWWAYRADQLTAGKEASGLPDYLHVVDVLTGADSRHPYLDDLDLVEVMLGLAPELSYDALRHRPLLRASVKGLLPEGVRLRARKSYFETLVHDSLTRIDAGPVRGLLTGPEAHIRPLVRPEWVRHLLDNPPLNPDGSGPWTWAVWRLLTAECWLRSQSDASFPERTLAQKRLEPPVYELRTINATSLRPGAEPDMS